MAAVVELLPITLATATAFEQAGETVVDVSGYTEAGLMIHITNMDVNSGTTTITVETAIDNYDDQWHDLVTKTYTSNPELPTTVFYYLAGSTTGSSTAPGFARYLRAKVDQASGASITLGVKALMKP